MVRVKLRQWCIFPVFWLLQSGPCSPAQGAPAGPEAVLQQMTDTVLAEIRRDPGQFQDVARVRALAERYILPHVDFQVAAQWALGKYWRTATPVQRERFVREFRRLLLNTYLRSIDNYRENRIRILPARGELERGRATVDAEVELPGGPTVHVAFRLHRPESDWLVYDISVEGVSLVATHRSGFAQEIRDMGLDSLIARLAELNAEYSRTGTGGDPASRSGP